MCSEIKKTNSDKIIESAKVHGRERYRKLRDHHGFYNYFYIFAPCWTG